MAWKVDELISWFKVHGKPGDIIFTGTPAGVGKQSEDKIEAEIENIDSVI